MTAKRAFDVMLGTIGAVLVVPVILAASAGIAISFRTWRVLFIQERIGYQGRRFKVPKLRTLGFDVAPDADKYALESVPLTRVGGFLRRSHIDELPQLFLVPFGRMSIVGPRPEMPRLAANFSPGFADLRHSVRPGCTGLWQISVDAGKLLHEAPQYDEVYVQHRSMALDLWILGETLRQAITHRQGIRLSDAPIQELASARFAVDELS